MLRPLFLTAAILVGSPVVSLAADLAVTVKGASPASGQFLVSVFDRSRTWMKQPVGSQTRSVLQDGTGTVTFTLAPGTYAVALIHDVNGNGKMDTNVLGIPIETFGFSNRARARLGPPKFGKAAFDLPMAGAWLTISLDRTNR